MKRLLTALCLGLFAGLASAQSAPEITSSERFDGYEVNYSVFPSTFLAPQIAGAHAIERAPNRSVVNISVRRQEAAAGQPARVGGAVSDLINRKPLAFREIREPGATYYIASFVHGKDEAVNFEIEVQPEGGPAHTVKFSRRVATQE